MLVTSPSREPLRLVPVNGAIIGLSKTQDFTGLGVDLGLIR